MKIMRMVLTAVSWIGALAAASAANWYVATNGTGGGTSWADATNSLQGAIVASSAADTVWVSNGVYQTGGVTNYPSGTILTNRIAIDKAITVRSANNDPANTIIKGARDPATTNGAQAARCVYMINGSSLIGFTLTNGATLRTNESAQANDRNGGSVLCQSVNAVISNCVLAGNVADVYGGGARYGTLYNCTLSGNSAIVGAAADSSILSNSTVSGNVGVGNYAVLVYCTAYNCLITGNSGLAYGGGAYVSTLYSCTFASNSAPFGGGAYQGTLYNCTLASNTASYGAGSYQSTMYNCRIVGNEAAIQGGGVYQGTLYNCSVVGNTAPTGGGVYFGTYVNSIIYFNSASSSGSNWTGAVSFTNSCTMTNQPGWGAGNTTADPSFMANGSGYGTNHVAGNYRLNGNSPGIDAGINFSWMTNANDARSLDLDGQPRIRYAIVDMGAYEKLLEGTIFYFR